MECVRGVPITVYKQQQTPKLPELLEKFCRACSAIDYANELRIIHCDLKPQHILIDGDGQLHVIDFGLARLLDPSLPRDVRRFFEGTPAYMSPEQVTDKFGKIGPGADVYALGIILFELLAGRRPYEVPSWPPDAIQNAILDAAPTKLGELDRRFRGKLEDIVSKAIQREPKERYTSVNALEVALRRYLHETGDPISSRPDETVIPSAGSKLFDAFLSYNSEDRLTVREMAERLRAWDCDCTWRNGSRPPAESSARSWPKC